MKFGLKENIANMAHVCIVGKPMRALPLFMLLMVSVHLLSCRTPGSKDSDVKHEFGQTRRDVDGLVHKTCVQDQDPIALYLRDLAVYIAQSNPESFTGEKSIDKFCFSVTDYGNMAEAFPIWRLVRVNKIWLWKAMSDAEIAYVLSHEMAHVLMSHIKGSTVKIEEEADEVGYEIYLRAQLHAETFSKAAIKALIQLDGKAVTDKCSEDISKGIVGEAGNGSHPDACYRMANIDILEKEAHIKDYAALKEKAVLIEVPHLAGRLKSVHDLLYPDFKKVSRD